MTLEPEPRTIIEGRFRVENFGPDYYYPPSSVIDKLEKVIILTEPVSKRLIPNGSIFIYSDDAHYNPTILGDDVGCGITVVKIPRLDEGDPEVIESLIKAVNDVNIHIGQGNHFLDFAIQPNFNRFRPLDTYIYLHSGFNSNKHAPTTFQGAKDQEQQSVDSRIEYLGKLASILQSKMEAIGDWTHNSVQQRQGKLVYRKGAINIERNPYGLLAINPILGFKWYKCAGDKTENSMPHGIGNIGPINAVMKKVPLIKEGIAIGYLVSRLDREENSEDYSNLIKSMETFQDQFATHTRNVRHSVPYLVIKTKQ